MKDKGYPLDNQDNASILAHDFETLPASSGIIGKHSYSKTDSKDIWINRKVARMLQKYSCFAEFYYD